MDEALIRFVNQSQDKYTVRRGLKRESNDRQVRKALEFDCSYFDGYLSSGLPCIVGQIHLYVSISAGDRMPVSKRVGGSSSTLHSHTPIRLGLSTQQTLLQ